MKLRFLVLSIFIGQSLAATFALKEIPLKRGGSIFVDSNLWELAGGNEFGRKTELLIFHKKMKDFNGVIFAGSPSIGKSNLKKECSGKNKTFKEGARPICITKNKDNVLIEFSYNVKTDKNESHLNYIISFNIPASKMKAWSEELTQLENHLRTNI